MNLTKNRFFKILMLIGCGVFILMLLLVSDFRYFVKEFKGNYLSSFFWNLKSTALSPIFLSVVMGTLLAQKIFPVKKQQKTLSVGLFQDASWFVYATLIETTVIVVYVGFLKGIYSEYFAHMTMDAIINMPYILRFSWGILLGDFLSWLQHWVKHKVPWFWEIHAIHHSQREMNFFTDFRFHIAEYFISRSIAYIPLLILAPNTPHLMAYAVFKTWWPRFYHGNIRLNFGPLRYILVTPQSHRIHHSFEKKHQDTNFGVIFCIWDRLFGTQYQNAEEYPETGIKDEKMPIEKEVTLWSMAFVPIEQTIYPFIRIGQSIKRNFVR